eukprot:g23157.t2
MLAIVTAQVAKSGELLQTFIGLPYIAGCLLPSILLGAFAFEMPAKIVERTNTLLTVSMVLGFGLLVVSTSMSKLSNLGVLLGAFPAVLLYGILPPMALLLRREKSGLGRKAVLGALTAISSVFLLARAVAFGSTFQKKPQDTTFQCLFRASCELCWSSFRCSPGAQRSTWIPTTASGFSSPRTSRSGMRHGGHAWRVAPEVTKHEHASARSRSSPFKVMPRFQDFVEEIVSDDEESNKANRAPVSSTCTPSVGSAPRVGQPVTQEVIALSTNVNRGNMSQEAFNQKLTHLQIQNKRIGDLEGLKLVPGVYVLYAYDNLISSLAGIQSLRRLQQLYLQNNRITTMAGLEAP